MSNPLVRVARGVEQARFLDAVDDVVRPWASTTVRSPRARALLHGEWLGHAVHPPLTDLPLGLWLSGTLLDLVGDSQSAPAARRLIGLGVLTALPTALTGVAEWAGIDTRRDRRTGLVHAAANSVALGLYVASWRARAGGRRGGRGTGLALAGGLAAAAGGFFGGHLTEARKVSSRDLFSQDG